MSPEEAAEEVRGMSHRIEMEWGVGNDDIAEAEAEEILQALRPRDVTLQGATQPAPEGAEIATAGEYAAAWNAATAEERQTHLERARGNAAAATRCFLEDHSSLLELVTYWRRRAEYAEDVLASAQAELRSGPTT